MIGGRQDPHVIAVVGALESKGARVQLIDRYCATDTISFSLNGSQQFVQIRDGAREINLNDVRAIWWRQKPMKVWDLDDPENLVAHEFAEREWGFLLRSLTQLAPGAFWINRLVPHVEWARKPAQLQLARHCGFSVPATIVSNDPSDVLNFVKEKKVIYKPLSNFVFPPDEYTFATLIKESDLDNRNSIRRAPGIYQEYVEKKYELRVTYVSGKTFWIKIDSQARRTTETDWRKSQLEDMYSIVPAYAETDSIIRKFMRSAGLEYGAFDLVVDPHGRVWFLECNPAGQWLWLEELTGVEIVEELAACLLTNGVN